MSVDSGSYGDRSPGFLRALSRPGQVGTAEVLDDLAGATELAEEHGVSRRTISLWVNRPGFPPPRRRFAMGPAYSRREVREWRERGGGHHVDEADRTDQAPRG